MPRIRVWPVIALVAALVSSPLSQVAVAQPEPTAAGAAAGGYVPPAILSPAPPDRVVPVEGEFSAPTEAEAPAGSSTGTPVPKPRPQVAPGQEVVEQRTATSKTFATADPELFTTKISATPVHYRAGDGRWQDVDPSLAADGAGGFRPRGVAFGLSLAGTASSRDLARIDVGEGRSASFGLAGARDGTAVVSGASVRYSEALPGVDVRLEVNPLGVKEELVLASRSAQNVFDFRLDLSGLTVELDASGALVYKDAAGEVALRTPPGWAEDSAGETAEERGALTGAVDYELISESDGSKALRVTLDRAWLDDPARVFPVTIDPTLAVGAQINEAYYSGGITESPGQVQVGNPYQDCCNVWRSTVYFPYEELFGKVVEGARVHLFNLSSGTTSAYDVCLSHASSFSFDGYDPSSEMCVLASGWSADFYNGQVYSQYKTAIDNRWGGWSLSFAGNESQYQFTYKKFFSFELHIDWREPNRPPAEATPLAPANGATFHNLTPELSVSGSDPDGDPVDFYYKVCRNPDAETNCVWESGWTRDTRRTVPAGVLAWNTTYYWHVYTGDGKVTTAPSWVWQFTPTNSAPPTPPPAAPADKAETATAEPTLSAEPVADPDSPPDPVSYFFRISTGDDGHSQNRIESGWLPTPSWTPDTGALRDGQLYTWTVAARDSHGAQSAWSGPRTFRVDLRAGSRPAVPFDDVAPVSVNLANGNVLTSVATPSVATLGGPLGVTMSYNSVVARTKGLTGAYYNDDNANSAIDPEETPTVVRSDPTVSFDWGGGSPAPGVGADYFLARWTGFITVPTTGTYTFGRISDDGTRIWVNDTLLVDHWYHQGAPAAPVYGNGIHLDAQTKYAIQVDYYEYAGAASMQLWSSGPGGAAPVPTSWLSSDRPGLPDGWTLSADVDGTLGYTHARVDDREIQVFDSTGADITFFATPGGWKPEDGVDSVLAHDARTGLLVLHGEDGQTYNFRADGSLESVRSAVDDPDKVAAATYTWTAPSKDAPARLTAITDPVTGRAVRLTYGPGTGTDPCPAAAPFDAAPQYQLCKISYREFGLGDTHLYYSNTRVARVVSPGDEQSDFGYDGAGRMTRLRSPYTNDLIRAGRIAIGSDPADVQRHETLVDYDAQNGRATKTAGPTPSSGAARPEHTYTYNASSPPTRLVHVAGTSQPHGWTRKVTLSATGRVAAEADAANNTTRYEWDSGDRPTKNVDPTGVATRNVYDHAGRLTDTYGPATEAELNAGAGPRARTAYDEGIPGLAATYWTNPHLAGAPAMSATGVGDPTGSLLVNWGAGGPAGLATSDGFSARYTGDITFPAAGYTLTVCGDDGTRAWVDDTLVADNWASIGCATSTWTSPDTKPRRIRVEHREFTGNSDIGLYWTPASGTQVVVPGGELAPRYGLATSAVDPDGRRTETRYPEAHRGLPTNTIVDPGGLNLSTTTDYETAGGGFARRLWRQLPKGQATRVTYAYYANTETRDNPCTTEADPGNQAGALRLETNADPDGPQGPIQREHVYDAAGRPVATRVVGDTNWRCTTYDARGRVTATTDSAGNRTTTNYDTPDTIVTDFADSDGAARTTVTQSDWAGRGIGYTDELGTLTRTTYDQAGRATATYRRFPNETAERTVATYGYDDAGRNTTLTDHLTGTARATTFGYDPGGRLRTIARPNGITTTHTNNPSRGWLDAVTHTGPAGDVAKWTYDRYTSGKVRADTADGRNRTYTYDPASRLTRTVETAPTTNVTRDYSYDSNTNRCSTTTTCDGSHTYDNADRVTTSPVVARYHYDNHGNLTSTEPRDATAPAATIGYDANDHAITINDGKTTTKEALAPSGRVLRRTVTPVGAGVATEDVEYGYAGPGDSPAYHRPALTDGPVTTYLTGPAGLLLSDTAGVTTWPLANAHGDIIGTTNPVGTYTANPTNDEFGVGAQATDRLGWLGAHQRYTTGGTLNLSRMGVRLYDPTLGRFLEVDPVEGGSCNSYEYACGDAVNNTDLDGRQCLTGVARYETRRSRGPSGRVYVYEQEICNRPIPHIKRELGSWGHRILVLGGGLGMRVWSAAKGVPKGPFLPPMPVELVPRNRRGNYLASRR